MSDYRKASVTEVKTWGSNMQLAILEFVDGERGEGVVIEELAGKVKVSDEVIVNTTAVDLGLGSGGYHFVLWNLSNQVLVTPTSGHIMKLRYTPVQMNVSAIEELLEEPDEAGDLSEALSGVPVVAGSVHSQLLPAAIGYKKEKPDGRLIYIMTDGGALPINFSKTVDFLKNNKYLEYTITCGHAFGGDLEAVNIFGALIAAKRVCRADAVIAVMGPGIVGTGSAVGFSGMEQSTIVNATASLGGTPVAIPRIAFHDHRDRHRGLSHHTVAAVKYGIRARSYIPVPVMEEEKEEVVLAQLRENGIDAEHDIERISCGEMVDVIKCCGFGATVMGRGVDKEPEYFMAAAAAGILAARTGGER
ncbi:MAG: DUF3866 family protein [Actinobacteria bacterium]|nr:DUF3866 family protein [Actinomycetota bacterium]